MHLFLKVLIVNILHGNYSQIVDIAGTFQLLSKNSSMLVSTDIADSTEVCRKDIGDTKKLRKWSRGHQFVVRGGGQIDTWQPLYRQAKQFTLYLI